MMTEVSEPVLIQTLRVHRGEVTCVDAYGGFLATGGGDRALRVFRWVRGAGWEERDVVRAAHRYGVTAARWSDGGALLASAGVDGVARAWSRALAPRRMLAAPSAAAARALCWAGGGRLLVGHDDGSLCAWHVPRAVLLARVVAHQGSLQAIAVPALRRLLLTACTEGVLKVFSLTDVCRSRVVGETPPTPLTWVDGAHDLGALCADAAEDSTVAATGGHDALIRVWRATEGARGVLAPEGTLAGHAAAVSALRWGRGAYGADSLLASASLDRTARLWLPAAQTCLHVVHAHPRYLTCIALAYDLSYIVTGSNDKSVRMFAMGALSLDDDLEQSCAPLTHFALGDLEGIGPVADAAADETGAAGGGARCVWAGAAHAGAINCIDAHGDLLATASSDGTVKILRWCESEGEFVTEHLLEAHQYPAMAAEFGAAGALLLTAGLDGCALLWDVRAGCQLRSLVAAAVDGEAGGGGVRGARLSPHRPPLLLLATDDGVAPLWTLADTDPSPTHTYNGHAEAVSCCAWSSDGRLLATGAASGELRLHAPPPAARTLHHHSDAHDLGVQSCDFASTVSMFDLPNPECSYILASGGCDATIKLWLVLLDEEEGGVRVRLMRAVEAHGGGVTCVRWGRGADGALLASAGADGWARVWRAGGADGALEAVAALPAEEGRGALAVALAERGAAEGALLAVGSMSGELALWRLPIDAEPEDDEGVAPQFWGEAGVGRWLREYVTRAPGCATASGCAAEARLLAGARRAALTGARLLDDDIDQLLDDLVGDDSAELDEKVSAEMQAARARVADELAWLRRAPAPRAKEAAAPHALLCPLSHRLLREPARAADGFSYERANIHEWLLAEGAVSPLTGRALGGGRALPNHALRERLRAYLAGDAPLNTPDT